MKLGIALQEITEGEWGSIIKINDAYVASVSDHALTHDLCTKSNPIQKEFIVAFITIGIKFSE